MGKYEISELTIRGWISSEDDLMKSWNVELCRGRKSLASIGSSIFGLNYRLLDCNIDINSEVLIVKELF